MTEQSTAFDELGPIDYVVIEFPDGGMHGEGLPLLVDLVDRGVIRVLDLEFVTRRPDGTLAGIEAADFDANGLLDLAVFAGSSSHLLDAEDFAEAGALLEPGSSAAILIYENTWAAPFATALRRNGARMVATGHIRVADLVGALDAADAEAAGV